MKVVYALFGIHSNLRDTQFSLFFYTSKFNFNILLLFYFRFKGHQNHDYKIDNCLNREDTCVVSGSEDGYVYFWDLVEVIIICVVNRQVIL